MTTDTKKCPHCGLIHATTCPRIKVIEYHPDGTVKRVELNQPGVTRFTVARPGNITYCDDTCTNERCSDAHQRREVVARIDCDD